MNLARSSGRILLKGLFEGVRVLNRIQAKNSVLLRRPVDVLTARDAPGPAPRVGEPLSFLKIRFDAAQFRFDPRAVGSGPERDYPIRKSLASSVKWERVCSSKAWARSA